MKRNHARILSFTVNKCFIPFHFIYSHSINPNLVTKTMGMETVKHNKGIQIRIHKIYIYIYIHARTHTHMHKHMCTRTHTRSHTHTISHTHSHTLTQRGSKKCTHSLIVNIFGTKLHVVTILARYCSVMFPLVPRV
jgi:hypothetical protein